MVTSCQATVSHTDRQIFVGKPGRKEAMRATPAKSLMRGVVFLLLRQISATVAWAGWWEDKLESLSQVKERPL